MLSADRDAFIGAVSAFTLHPSEQRAVMLDAVELLGVMPDIGAQATDVRKIAAYIYDASFAPPCVHWQASMKAAKARGDMQHYKKDKLMFDRVCVNRGSAPIPRVINDR